MILLRDGGVLGTSNVIVPRTVPVTDLLILSHGDSMTRDLESDNYLHILKSLVVATTGDYVTASHRGINGISYDFRWEFEPINTTLLLDAPTTIDPRRIDGIDNWLIVFAGSNGMAIGGHSAATEYADFKTYIDARIAAGWVADNIVAVTMMPRNGFADATRQAFNAAMVGDDDELGYRVARADLDDDIGGEGDCDDTDFYYDGTHLNAAGHARLAQIIHDTMFP